MLGRHDWIIWAKALSLRVAISDGADSRYRARLEPLVLILFTNKKTHLTVGFYVW